MLFDSFTKAFRYYTKTNKNLNSVSAFQRIILPESKDIETIINSKEKPFYDFIKLLEKAQEFKNGKKRFPKKKIL